MTSHNKRIEQRDQSTITATKSKKLLHLNYYVATTYLLIFSLLCSSGKTPLQAHMFIVVVRTTQFFFFKGDIGKFALALVSGLILNAKKRLTIEQQLANRNDCTGSLYHKHSNILL